MVYAKPAQSTTRRASSCRTTTQEPIMALSITSTAFRPSGAIPSRCTCDGEDLAPALEWSGVPDGAQSLVLVVDDPDAPDPAAPTRTWVHWVLLDIPPSAAGLP